MNDLPKYVLDLFSMKQVATLDRVALNKVSFSCISARGMNVMFRPGLT